MSRVPSCRDEQSAAASGFDSSTVAARLLTKGGRFCSDPGDAPRAAGAYVLVIDIGVAIGVRMAGRAAGTLRPGRYYYCGSAKGPGGLKARLARHMRRRKSVRWHVDQLTTRGRVRGAWVMVDGDECELVAALSHLSVPIPGFGSSDCGHCLSHLLAPPRA